MRSRHRSLLAPVLVGGLLALAPMGRSQAHAASLRVVATVGDLAAIARDVLGSHGQVVLLARPTQDPHFVDARPNLILDLNRADALVTMGLDYEVGWLPVLIRGARNPRIQPGAPGYIIASQMVPLQGVPQGRVDRSMGDIHPGGNPHFTLDPRNGVTIARALAQRLGDVAPELRSALAANAEQLAKRAEQRIRGWEQRLARARGVPAVSYHRSFVYLMSWLGLVDAGTVEPKPGIPPNAAHVARLIGDMRSRKVPIILQERWYPSAVSERVASQTGARLLLLAGMTAEQQTYLDHIEEIVAAVDGALAAAPQKAGTAPTPGRAETGR